MKSVTVVGCGIVGLTSAIALQEKGWNVRIVAKERYEHTLSEKVGAIWFPFEVHPIEAATRWGTRAYQRYLKEVIPGNGVSFIPFTVVYNRESNTSWTEKLPKGAVRDARQDELPLGVETAYVATVPLAEPPIYLPHLFERFIAQGGTFEIIEIKSLEELSQLDACVINCSGLGAKSICQDDQLSPMRGQILRAAAMDIQSCVNSTQAGALSYIIKRSTDCIIGGTDYLDDWNLNVEQSDTDLILARFRNAGLSKIEPTILENLVGLRPRRTEVRFELDSEYKHVFHNYGHGGAGFTVAWGCALELGDILE